MQVAIASVAKDDDGQVVFFGNLLEARHHLWNGATGHSDVFSQLVGSFLTQRWGNRPPRLPQLIALGCCSCHFDLTGTSLAADVGHDLDVALGVGLVAVGLDDQDGLGLTGQPHVEVVFHRVDRRLVHQFQCGRQDASAQHSIDGLAGVGQLGESDQSGALGLRHRQQFHRHLGNNAQGALRTDEELH